MRAIHDGWGVHHVAVGFPNGLLDKGIYLGPCQDPLGAGFLRAVVRGSPDRLVQQSENPDLGVRLPDRGDRDRRRKFRSRRIPSRPGLR